MAAIKNAVLVIISFFENACLMICLITLMHKKEGKLFMIMQSNGLFEADVSFTSKVQVNISCFQFQPMQNLGGILVGLNNVGL